MTITDNTQYKSKIMDKIINTPDVVTLINNPAIISSQPDSMKNVNVFSRMKIPNTTLNVKNYICFNFNSRIHSANKVFKDIIFEIAIICHEDEVDIDGTNRHDLLAGVISEAFNWSKFLGFELELTSDTESILEKEYYCRTLQFRNLTPNSLSNGEKMDGD
jgi:hypothetical protein